MRNEWHVLGAGSIGSVFAAALSDAGHPTTLVIRNKVTESTDNDHSRTFYLRQGGQQKEYLLSASPAHEQRYISHLLITTKAYDAGAALASIAHRLDKDSNILILVNGMGVLQELEAQHSHLHYYCGTTTEGAYRHSPQEFVHAGTGITKIGGQHSAVSPEWLQQWQNMTLACCWEADIQTILWQKLAVNCAINPLTAIYQCNNGELHKRTQLSEKLGLLCDEIAAISAAAGHLATAKQLHQSVAEVITGTAKNRSSMLQDILANKPTEIQYISGYMVTTAKRLGIPAPINSALLQAIRDLQH